MQKEPKEVLWQTHGPQPCLVNPMPTCKNNEIMKWSVVNQMSTFSDYPGFTADLYREYLKVVIATLWL